MKITCPYCGKQLIRKAGFAPNGAQRYLCNYCGRKFNEHTMTEKVVLIPCPHCSSKNVKRAGKTSKGVQRYVCKDCNKSFNLTARKPVSSRHICPKCGKQDVCKNGFTASKKQVYLCKNCFHKFISEQDKYHKKTCIECGYPYAKKCGTAHGEQYYECISCHKKFKDNYVYKKVSEDLISKIRSELTQGKTRKALSEKYNLSERRIKENTKDIKTFEESKIKIIDKAILNGHPLQRIVEQFEMPKQLVQRRARVLSYKNTLTKTEITSILDYGLTFNIALDRIKNYVHSNSRNKQIVEDLYKEALEKRRIKR